ncbi:MAG: GNAT family N-acetyltransferase, partial [Ktedonobacterales bacterium]
METIELRDVTQENWREALRLTVQPDQQRFISDYTPIVALALAKAYVRPGGAIWAPYLIYASTTMVGFVELAYEPDTLDEYWIFHFFIDRRYQGRGYGRVA